MKDKPKLGRKPAPAHPASDNDDDFGVSENEEEERESEVQDLRCFWTGLYSIHSWCKPNKCWIAKTQLKI